MKNSDYLQRTCDWISSCSGILRRLYTEVLLVFGFLGFGDVEEGLEHIQQQETHSLGSAPYKGFQTQNVA